MSFESYMMRRKFVIEVNWGKNGGEENEMLFSPPFSLSLSRLTTRARLSFPKLPQTVKSGTQVSNIHVTEYS